MRILKNMTAALLCCVLISFPMKIRAENENASVIYVAGNPDFYPVEYYDKQSDSYRGLMPALLSRIAAETGLRFEYIMKGAQDERLYLAKNLQVELISGLVFDAQTIREYALDPSGMILKIPDGDGAYEICFAFTKVMDSAARARFEGCLDSIRAEDIAAMLAAEAMEEEKTEYPFWLVIASVTAVLALAAVIIAVIVHYRRKIRDLADGKILDSVTGIGNLKYFELYFDQYVNDHNRMLYCVIYFGVDLEKIRRLNYPGEDHEALKYIADVLCEYSLDTGMAAHVTDDGFAVLHMMADENQAEAFLQPIFEKLDSYRQQFKKDYSLDVTAGIYFLQKDDRKTDMILYNAMQTYRYAVRQGLSYAVCDAGMVQSTSEVLQLHTGLEQAFRERQFAVYLQFIVEAGTGAVIGAEALARWKHPQRGLLTPDKFVFLLDQESMLATLDFYILEQTCAYAMALRPKNGFYFSCNFSRSTLTSPDFEKQLKAIAARYPIAALNLVAEVTEDIVVSCKDSISFNILLLKQMGFQIALDDFGSGNTSFSDLKVYPIDFLKLDRNQLCDENDEKGCAVLSGMIDLGHKLKMKILCEGIQTREQAELVRTLGCDYLQGFYYYRPMPEDVAKEELSDRFLI